MLYETDLVKKHISTKIDEENIFFWEGRRRSTTVNNRVFVFFGMGGGNATLVFIYFRLL